MIDDVRDLDVRLEHVDEAWAASNAVAIGRGVLLPRRFGATCEAGAYRVKVVIDVDAGGPHVNEVRVERKGVAEVSGEVLRKIPVASIANDAVRQALFVVLPDGRAYFGAYERFQDVPEEVREEWPDGELEEFLATVAWQYRFAEAVGEGPTASVAKGMGVSRATAGRMVAEARRRGLLPSAEDEARDILNFISEHSK